jgi:hypothetical protein
MAKVARKKQKRKPRTVPPPNFDDYWQHRMEGATSRLKAAQQIVSHPGTRGSLAENLVREVIREFLPQRWAVGTGFIMDVTRGRSNQVDVLVYDQLTTSPVYRDGELVILSPGTARVAVEVKSNLDKKEIPVAYDNICSIKNVDPAVLGLIFGYDGVTDDTFVRHVRAWAKPTGTPPRQRWPDRVFNMGQNFLVSPDPDALDTRGFVVARGDDPIVRFFLTTALTKLGLENLRPFMRADKSGQDLHKL